MGVYIRCGSHFASAGDASVDIYMTECSRLH